VQRQGGGRPRAAFFFYPVGSTSAYSIDPNIRRPYHSNVQPVLSASQMRRIDLLTTQDYRTPSLLLMQAAVEACSRAIEAHFCGNLAGKKAQILCGQGNNGGDGAALARELSRAGVFVDVILFGTVPDATGDARTNFEIVQRLANFEASSLASKNHFQSGVSFVECDGVSAWEELASRRRTYDIVVDALFGTGLSRPLEGLFAQVVQHVAMARSARERSSDVRPFIFSIDIPSGLKADSPKIIGDAVQADLTVTFTAPKPANVLPPAAHFNGRVIIANIGSPYSLVEAANPSLFVIEKNDARDWLVSTRYTHGTFKNSHGHAMIVAGSRGYTGAAALCGNAAMNSGAGLVTIATPMSAQTSVAAAMLPEVMTMALAETDLGVVSDQALDQVMGLASKASVIALGPGLSSEDKRTHQFVYNLVKQRVTPVVIDADGLNCLAKYSSNGWPADLHGSKEAPLVLTPHPGEMLRLLGTTDKSILDDYVSLARSFATKYNLILLLKGTRSLVAAPDGRVFINPTGNAGLGTAGSGDTLTGIIAGFIAQSVATLGNNFDVLLSTVAALYVGGLAGDMAARKLGMRTMVASDIRKHLSEAIRSLDPEGELP
jgi:ADP-dependent NAD(P)H-hydrate dehydratase / NAD(P)H-hydrate epimerase